MAAPTRKKRRIIDHQVTERYCIYRIQALWQRLPYNWSRIHDLPSARDPPESIPQSLMSPLFRGSGTECLDFVCFGRHHGLDWVMRFSQQGRRSRCGLEQQRLFPFAPLGLSRGSFENRVRLWWWFIVVAGQALFLNRAEFLFEST